MLSDMNHPTITASVTVPDRVWPSFPRNRRHPPNPQYSAVSLFATSDDYIFRVDVEHLLPDADSDNSVLQPISHYTQSNILSYLFPHGPLSRHPLKSFTPTDVWCRMGCFGSTRGIIVMENLEAVNYQVDEWQLVLSTFKDQQFCHRSLHIHGAQVMRDLEVENAQWDEVSGRICLVGYHEQTGLIAPIVILEL